MAAPTPVQDLLGRERELALIDELLRRAGRGDGAAVMFSGDPGTGKTALLDEARRRAVGVQSLACCGAEWEVELPYSALNDLLRPLLPLLDTVPAPQRRALEGALGLADHDEVQVLGVLVGTLTLLVEATRRGPLLVLVDDLQWIDSASMQALAFVAKRLGGEELAMVIGSRPEGRLPGLESDAVTLAPLDIDAVATLANRQLDVPLPEDAVRHLAAATGGNPLAVVESVRQFGEELRERGSLLDGPLPVGQVIERAFEGRLASVSADARTALEVIAISLGGDVSEVLGALAELGVPEHAITELETARVARRMGRAFVVDHPLLRALVHQATTAQERRRCQRALASASTADAAHRAWYAASAAEAPDESIAQALDDSAQRFITTGGFVAAAQALSRSAELTPDLDRRADRFVRASRSAHVGGRSAWAVTLLDAARVAAIEPRTAVRVAFERVTLDAHLTEGEGMAAAQLAIADAAQEVDPDVAALALATGAMEASVSGKGDLLSEALRRLDERAGDPQLSAASLDAVDCARGVALLMAGTPGRGEEARALVREGAQRRLGTAHGVGVTVFSEVFLVEALLWTEDYALCEALCDHAGRRAQEAGDVYTLRGILPIEGMRRYRLGDWQGARASLEGAIRLSEYSGLRWLVAQLKAHLAVMDAACGDASVLITTKEMEVDGSTFGFDIVVQATATAVGLLHLGAGRHAEAVTSLARAAEWTRRAGQVDPGSLTWPSDLVEARLLSGDRDGAVAELAALRALTLNAGSRPWRAGVVAKLDGMLADEDAYEAQFIRSLELFSQIPAPFDRARVQLAFGQRLRRSRRRVDARDQLNSALVEFDRLGAVPWADQARRELGASAPSVKRGPAFEREALTPQEQQVARLVAAGQSNKDVAGSMFLSPKTIEAHLSRIYRKLGVSSRTQLAARMRDA